MRFRGWHLVVFAFAVIPLGVWILQAAMSQLGADPGKALVDRLGLSALWFLLIGLSMTPLQLLTRWAGWVSVRRQLGLWCFTYALLHVLAYVLFLLEMDFSRVLPELSKRPYIMVGAAAFSGLLVMALTSNRYSIRRLGRRWKRLHRLVYGVLCLVLLHMLWVVRADMSEWLGYASAGALLLIVRLQPIRMRLARIAPKSAGRGPQAS